MSKKNSFVRTKQRSRVAEQPPHSPVQPTSKGKLVKEAIITIPANRSISKESGQAMRASRASNKNSRRSRLDIEADSQLVPAEPVHGKKSAHREASLSISRVSQSKISPDTKGGPAKLQALPNSRAVASSQLNTSIVSEKKGFGNRRTSVQHQESINDGAGTPTGLDRQKNTTAIQTMEAPRNNSISNIGGSRVSRRVGTKDDENLKSPGKGKEGSARSRSASSEQVFLTNDSKKAPAKKFRSKKADDKSSQESQILKKPTKHPSKNEASKDRCKPALQSSSRQKPQKKINPTQTKPAQPRAKKQSDESMSQRRSFVSSRSLDWDDDGSLQASDRSSNQAERVVKDSNSKATKNQRQQTKAVPKSKIPAVGKKIALSPREDSYEQGDEDSVSEISVEEAMGIIPKGPNKKKKPEKFSDSKSGSGSDSEIKEKGLFRGLGLAMSRNMLAKGQYIEQNDTPAIRRPTAPKEQYFSIDRNKSKNSSNSSNSSPKGKEKLASMEVEEQLPRKGQRPKQQKPAKKAGPTKMCMSSMPIQIESSQSKRKKPAPKRKVGSATSSNRDDRDSAESEDQQKQSKRPDFASKWEMFSSIRKDNRLSNESQVSKASEPEKGLAPAKVDPLSNRISKETPFPVPFNKQIPPAIAVPAQQSPEPSLVQISSNTFKAPQDTAAATAKVPEKDPLVTEQKSVPVKGEENSDKQQVKVPKMRKPKPKEQTAIKKPMQPHIVQVPKKNLKRKRPRQSSESFDEYGDEERSLSSQSLESLPARQRKKGEKNVKKYSSDESSLGEAPRKIQNRNILRQLRSSVSSEEIFGLDDEIERSAKPKKKPQKKKTEDQQEPTVEVESGNLHAVRQSIVKPVGAEAKPLVYNSLKERLAALQAEIKRAERPCEGQIARVEPVFVNDQMSLAQSRISQLINSTVSNPGGAKSIVTQLIENARNAKGPAPPSCLPIQNKQPVLSKRPLSYQKPQQPEAGRPVPMEIESNSSVVEYPAPAQVSSNPTGTARGNDGFERPMARPPIATDRLYESNVSRFTGRASIPFGRFSRQQTEKELNPLQLLISNFVAPEPPGSPSQFIVSRVVENKETIPQNLSTSRLEMILQQRRTNTQPVDISELPGLMVRQQPPVPPQAHGPFQGPAPFQLPAQFQAPVPGVGSIASGTQATVNASRIVPPPMRMVTIEPPLAPNAPPQKKYAKLCDLLTKEGYEVMIEENTRDPMSQAPDLLVAVSPLQRENYKRYQDVLHFQIFGQSYQPIRLGIFSVFNSNRKPLLAGYAIIFTSAFTSYHRIIEFFMHIHAVEPESILTNYQHDLAKAISYLQSECHFNAAHVISGKDVITLLERQIFGGVNFIDREFRTEPFFRFITQRSRERTAQCEQQIMDLSNKHSGTENKPSVKAILSEKQKICYSWLPNKFIGIGIQLNRQYFDKISNFYRSNQMKNHDLIAKELIQLDNELKNDESKLAIYSDPVETVFRDERLYSVRMALDYVVFKTFIKNYTEAYCHISLEITDERMLKQGSFDIRDRRTGERLKLARWECPCKDQKKTGVGCSHMIAGARMMPDYNYLDLIRKRWKSENIQQRAPSSEINKQPQIPSLGLNAAKQMSWQKGATVKPPLPPSQKVQKEAGRGLIMDFEDIELQSDDETAPARN